MTNILTSEAKLAARYGKSTSKGNSLTAKISYAVLLTSAIGVAAWYALAQPNQIDPTTLGFTVSSDSAVVVHTQVIAPKEETITCGIEALNRYKAVVGYLEVNYPTADQQIRRLDVTVQTTEPPVTGLISRCWTS